ncbi:hypothetical protein F5884DRAFT_491140 [Xylogone sp. PMI_703]|nr:hypothetical protein F5884DRAFT_491140 [Xylogone sp. PMI_703]
MISDDGQIGNASFARQLYLYSLTYLLRALPADLTTEDQLSIRSALAEVIASPFHIQLDPLQSSQTSPESDSRASNTPSFLHRTVAFTILNLFIIIHFLFPYLKYMLENAYAYERKHKISERVVSHGLDMADACGEKRVTVTEAISGIADGRVGRIIGEAGAWIVEEVVGGVNEGITDGIAVFRITRASADGAGLEYYRC